MRVVCLYLFVGADWFKLCRPEASTLALYFIQIQPEILSEYTHVPVLRSLLLKLV